MVEMTGAKSPSATEQLFFLSADLIVAYRSATRTCGIVARALSHTRFGEARRARRKKTLAQVVPPREQYAGHVKRRPVSGEQLPRRPLGRRAHFDPTRTSARAAFSRVDLPCRAARHRLIEKSCRRYQTP